MKTFDMLSNQSCFIEAHVKHVWAMLKQLAPERRLVIFGAGAHTAWLHDLVANIEGLPVVAVLDDHPSPDVTYWGLKPIRPEKWQAEPTDIILISTDSVGKRLTARCRNLFGEAISLINLYDGFPPGPYPKKPEKLKHHVHTNTGKQATCSHDLPPIPPVYKRWITKYLPDPNLVRRRYDLYWMLDFVRYARTLKKRFHNIHADQVAILLGNGPSVRIEDLERFDNAVTFACNRFYLCYDRTSFRPSYLVSADPTMIADYSDEMIQHAQCPVFFNTSDRSVLPHGDVYWIPSIFPHRAPLKFQPIIYKGLFCGGGTLISALQIGYYMGIRRFYLYGVDHHFTFETTASKDPTRRATGDGNHFIQNYRNGKPWFPPATKSIEESFRICDRYLRELGGFLKNATRGGNLDVLEREHIDTVLARLSSCTPSTH